MDVSAHVCLPLWSFLLINGLLLALLIGGVFLWMRRKRAASNVVIASEDQQTTNWQELDKEERRLINGIIRFSNEAVKEVMTPRSDVAAIEIGTSFQALVNKVVKYGYSRLPVYQEDLDHIIGVLYAKDLLQHTGQDDAFRWESLVRSAYKVPETQMIDELLRELQSKHIHIAIVLDEYGGTSGIITLEDIIEEIVGEIRDEYDDEEKLYTCLNPQTYMFEAKILLSDLCQILQLPDNTFDEVQGEADTLGGLLLALKGGFPKLHETIEWEGYQFKVTKTTPRRIIKVKITLPLQEEHSAVKEDEKKSPAETLRVLPILALMAFFPLFSCSGGHNKDAAQSAAAPEKIYQSVADGLPFQFEYPTTAQFIRTSSEDAQNAYFFDIDFPVEQARLYATYRTVVKSDREKSPSALQQAITSAVAAARAGSEIPPPADYQLATMYRESRKLVSFHLVRVQEVKEELYENPDAGVYATLYHLTGPVATPTQIAITDSASYLLHASLYFNSGANAPHKADTLAQLNRYIMHFVETFSAR